MQRGGNKGFPGSGWRVQDDVAVFEQLENGRLLRRIERQILVLDVFEKAAQQLIAAGKRHSWN
jgi:hypothetical protein